MVRESAGDKRSERGRECTLERERESVGERGGKRLHDRKMGRECRREREGLTEGERNAEEIERRENAFEREGGGKKGKVSERGR